MRDIVTKLRRYEIRIRKLINSQMQGDFHSIFKGSGLEFDEVREYQYGDDIRTIDWNVTAKGQGTYVKTFKEEKEQTVFFLLDVSGSQEIGSAGSQKLDISKQVYIDCDERLETLFKRSFPKAIVHGTRKATKVEWTNGITFDSRCAIGGLPQFFRKQSKSFPGTPFLVPDTDKVEMWPEVDPYLVDQGCNPQP